MYMIKIKYDLWMMNIWLKLFFFQGCENLIVGLFHVKSHATKTIYFHLQSARTA